MKRRIFSTFLTATMVLTQSAFVYAADATDATSTVSIPYTQNFDDANLTATEYSSGKNVAVTDTKLFEQKFENENGYGRFHQNPTQWYRIGFQVDENGVKEGKLNVSFRFRPLGLSDDLKIAGFVGLGDETSTTTDYISLLGISGGTTNFGKMGVLHSNGVSNPMKSDDGANAILTSADAEKWFTYNAVIDLDTHSLDAEVVREEDGAKYTYSKTGIATRTTAYGAWDLWPKITNMKKFVAMGPMDIDDLSITHILNAQELTFVSVNGEESDKCNILTSKAKIRFNTPVKAIGENAVTVDGNACSGGVISEDGMSYTFDVSEYLNLGTTHNVAVDTSKVEAALDGVLAGDGESFAFTVTPTIPYTQDFEDASLKAMDYSGTTPAVVTSTSRFEQKSDNGNGYGRFHDGRPGWYRIGFQVDEKGVTDGKLKVSFKFRPLCLSDDSDKVAFVGLGDTTGKDTNHLILLGISKTTNFGRTGVMESNGTSYPMKDDNNEQLVLTKDDVEKWFTYNAVIDLDTHSLDAEVVREDGKKYTYSKSNIATRAKGWGLWPISTKFQTFVSMGPIDIDDLSIKRMIKAEKLTFVSANGAESNECSIFTPKAKVEFNMAVKSIDENAVTMDGKTCPNGVLSADGMSYTFDIPENLISGTAHNIAVDTSKVEAVLNVVLPGDGESFDFTVSATEVKAPVYTQNFDAENLKAINFSGGATSATSNTNLFVQMFDNENGYGRFHQNNTAWYRIGFQVDENGVKEGKLNVSFRFRPLGLSDSIKLVGFVGLGDETSTTTDYLSLLGISGVTEKDGDKYFGRMGVLEGNGTSNSMKDAEGKVVQLTSADAEKWFTYNAVIDLDTHSLDAEVVREEDGAKYTYSKTGIAKRTIVKDGWGDWPRNTNMKKFVAMGPIDIDDFSMTYDTNPAIIADNAGVKASVIAATEGDNLLIVAQYDDAGNLVHITKSYVALEEGQSALLEADVAWDNTAKTAKAFIWDNFKNCTPLGMAKLASKPANE